MMRLTVWLLLLLTTDVLATPPCQRTYRTTTSIGAENDVSMRYLKRLLQTIQCPLKIVPYELSHQRRVRLLADGEIDLVMEASKLPERDSYAWFSLPYRDEKTLLITLRDKSPINQVKHINDVFTQRLTILSPAGGWFGPDVERERQHWRESHLLIVYKDPIPGFRDLRLGRAQLLLTTDLVFREHQLDDLVTLPFVVHQEAVYIMFSKRTVSAAEVAVFNDAIQLQRF